MLKKTDVWAGLGGGVIARESTQEVTLVCKSSRLRSNSRPEGKKKIVNVENMTSWWSPSRLKLDCR